MRKITWQKIYEDFKAQYPKMCKKVVHWQPHDYATIILYFNDGKKKLYNYDTREVTSML